MCGYHFWIPQSRIICCLSFPKRGAPKRYSVYLNEANFKLNLLHKFNVGLRVWKGLEECFGNSQYYTLFGLVPLVQRNNMIYILSPQNL